MKTKQILFWAIAAILAITISACGGAGGGGSSDSGGNSSTSGRVKVSINGYPGSSPSALSDARSLARLQDPTWYEKRDIYVLGLNKGVFTNFALLGDEIDISNSLKQGGLQFWKEFTLPSGSSTANVSVDAARYQMQVFARNADDINWMTSQVQKPVIVSGGQSTTFNALLQFEDLVPIPIHIGNYGTLPAGTLTIVAYYPDPAVGSYAIGSMTVDRVNGNDITMFLPLGFETFTILLKDQGGTVVAQSAPTATVYDFLNSTGLRLQVNFSAADVNGGVNVGIGTVYNNTMAQQTLTDNVYMDTLKQVYPPMMLSAGSHTVTTSAPNPSLMAPWDAPIVNTLVIIKDNSGNVVATSPNGGIGYGVVSFTVPSAGQYIIEVQKGGTQTATQNLYYDIRLTP